MNESDRRQKLDLGVSILAHNKDIRNILNTTILKKIKKGKNKITITILACSGFIPYARIDSVSYTFIF